MIVPIEVKGKLVSAVIDTGAQVTIVNSQFYDTLNLSLPSDPVLLKGIDPEKECWGLFGAGSSSDPWGKTYKWDLYVAPIEDQLLLGLDFMVHHKVDSLISQNALVIDDQYEIPAIIKWNPFKGTTKTETYGVARVKVNPHGQFPSADSPHNDYNTSGMPNVLQSREPNNSFFKGGGEEKVWMEFCQAAKPKCPNYWWNEFFPNSLHVYWELKSTSGIHLWHQMNLTLLPHFTSHRGF